MYYYINGKKVKSQEKKVRFVPVKHSTGTVLNPRSTCSIGLYIIGGALFLAVLYSGYKWNENRKKNQTSSQFGFDFR